MNYKGTAGGFFLKSGCFSLVLFFCNYYFSIGQKPIFNRVSIENGLSQSSVLTIVQDAKGFLWFGTRSGLNRFDTRNFRVYKNVPSDPKSISDNYILSSLCDSRKTLWIGTINGLNKYNAEHDCFKRITNDPSDKTSLSNNTVHCIYQDKKGRIWIGTDNGLNLMKDAEKTAFIRFSHQAGKPGLPGNNIRAIFEDHEGFLWIGTGNGLTRISEKKGLFQFKVYKNSASDHGSISGDFISTITEDFQHRLWIGTQHDGINLFDRTQDRFKRFYQSSGKTGLVHNNIRKIIPDKNGRLWIGTLEGISILDPLTQKFSSYQHDSDDPESIGQNSVYDIFRDDSGSMWIGTYYAGLSVVFSHATPFTIYRNSKRVSSISNNVISSITEDPLQNLWIGTEGGGLNYFDKKSGIFSNFRNTPGNASSLSSNLVKSVYLDRNKNLWIGTHLGGLNLFNSSSKTFRHFRHNPNDSLSISSDDIIDILEDSQGRLWIGTDQAGLNIMDRETGKFSRFSPKGLFSISSVGVTVLFEDSRKNIWVGTSGGLNVLQYQSEKFKTILKDKEHKNSLPSNSITCINEDSRKNIWIGTYFGGLCRYNLSQNTFTTFTEKDGLPGDNILGIQEDNQGFLWVSTNKGLSKFDPVRRNFRNYDVNDGLSGNEFNYNSCFKDSKGELFFGGYNGLIRFNPNEIGINDFHAPLVFTALKLFNKPVAVETEDNLLKKDISLADEIVFRHDQNIFTVDFALLNYIKSNKNKYAYKLEGFEKDWNYVNIPSATYTNLPSGEYNLLVKGANNDGQWTSEPVSLKIRVLPPFWKTWWAYCLYILFFAVILFFIIRFFLLRALLRQEHELHEIKLNFFTNISHEIRTHLTLITGPVEKLLISENTREGFQGQLVHVKNNTDRLLKLVGELMDFQKAESRHLRLHVSKINIVSLLSGIFGSFEHISEMRNIQSSLIADAEDIELYADSEQITKVFFNLLSNAYKFTPDGGSVVLKIAKKDSLVEIEVIDNGRGIAPEYLKKLFVNFFQVYEYGLQNTGYGIGLALSKSIVELHKGEISVESEVAHGHQNGRTCFKVSLPAGHAHFTESQLTPSENIPVYSFTAPAAETDENESVSLEISQKTSILVIEDNPEIRLFIRNSLNTHYQVFEAENGLKGWEMATELIPDLIISDVMMDQMNGLELCDKIKNDERTNHIPVILLTARATLNHQVEGLRTGADCYITKPFSIQVLALNIHNLLASREVMRQRFSRQITLQPQNTIINTFEEEFLDKVIQIIDNQMDNPEFGVVMLSEKVAMSQPILYKKLKALTDMSVNEFIKSIRLKKAAQLLQQKQMNIYEVSYAVGYDDRKYFSKEFKKLFGKTPSDYLNSFETRPEDPV
ncbi:Two component regulator propeller [Pseudarcicella hirudinis]|uniref:histidine kinase n=1 Tax=Pseudarcicella hirudinis TaxID=1079859 RepID=A0A1I5M156_9BACT|nr:hybrid sensor histidine kinase/response regulator transcription factor [Pseudarcicella hirudinis]SFP03180.1 Two component regulator propeller [Pseudarcicella hirudinis]